MRGGAFIMFGDWCAWLCNCASTGQNFIKSGACSCYKKMGLLLVALGLFKKIRTMLCEYRNMTSQAQMLVCASAMGWWGCCRDVVAKMFNRTYVSEVAPGVMWLCQVTNNMDSLENMEGQMVVRLHQIALIRILTNFPILAGSCDSCCHSLLSWTCSTHITFMII